MQNTTIPDKVIRLAKRSLKNGFPQWDHVTSFPASGIEVVTDGDKGKYKSGLRGWIIGGLEREVFVGADFVGNVNLRGVKIPEFNILLENGSQFLGQYGRDFKFSEVS